MTQWHASSYACSVRTARPAVAVLDDLARLDVEGVVALERSATYILLGPPKRPRYTPRQGVAATAALTLGLLVLSAWSLVLIILLPAAALPLLPFLLIDHPVLAVGAVEDEEGAVLVTVHGRADEALRRAVDAYLMGLPAVAGPAQEAGVPSGQAAS